MKKESNLRFVTRLAFVAMLVLVASCATTGAGAKVPGAPDLSGVWRSVSTEDMGNGAWATREFTMKGSDWQVVTTFYLDKDMKMPVFAFRAVGPYEITAASSKVAGAFEATFHFTKKFLTILTDSGEVLKAFGFASAGLETGKETDISATGASFLKSVADYPLEYDLVALKDGKLSLGARPADNDLSTVEKRPTKVGLPLSRP
jgi:hypothetical protein